MVHAELTVEECARFLGLIYQAAGIRISETKRTMIGNRVRRRLRATGIATFAEYYRHLVSPLGRDEMPRFLDAITTNETYFLRDPRQYDWFEQELLPELARRGAARERPKELRVWSAACSTGEEAYSIAMAIAAARLGPLLGWRATVLGTDLSGAALEAARAARYDARSVRLVDAERRKAHLDEDAAAGRWTVRPHVRALVLLKRHNLLEPIDEAPFDCIFLKNMLIYLDGGSKRIVTRHVVKALAPGGRLVVGPTDGAAALLGDLVRVQPWLYQKPGA